jgi:hypothetical protein
MDKNTFKSGDFVVYYHNDIPIHALVVQKYNTYRFQKYKPNSYIIYPADEYDGYIRLEENKLKLVKLSIDQKFCILTSFGETWFHHNKKLFQKSILNK